MLGFIILLIILILFGGSIAGLIYVLTRGSAARAKFAREAPYALSANAVVIGKRSEIVGYEANYTLYFVTFDIEGVGRAEFNVAGNLSGLLVEGDRGILRYLLNPLRLVNFTPASRFQQI